MQTLAAGIRPRLFISYARSDTDGLQTALNALRQDGAHFWLDVDEIEPGADWRAEISRAIREADEVMLLLSPTSAQRPIVREEIDIAIAAGKPVRPILIRGENEDCPDYVHRLQIVKPQSDSAEDIARAVRHFLAEPKDLRQALDTAVTLSHVATRTIFPKFEDVGRLDVLFRQAGPMLFELAKRSNGGSALVLNAGIAACHLGQHQQGLDALQRYAQATDNGVGWYFLGLYTPNFRSIASLNAPTVRMGAEAISKAIGSWRHPLFTAAAAAYAVGLNRKPSQHLGDVAAQLADVGDHRGEYIRAAYCLKSTLSQCGRPGEALYDALQALGTA